MSLSHISRKECVLEEEKEGRREVKRKGERQREKEERRKGRRGRTKNMSQSELISKKII